MISATTKHLIRNPTPATHETNGNETRELKARYAAEPPGVIEQRLRELDHEWSMERLTAAASGLALFGGTLLSKFLSADWLVLPAVMAGALLLYGLTGWNPASPLARLLGFRSSRGIAFERCALMASRGDFQIGNLVTTPPDRADLTPGAEPGVNPSVFNDVDIASNG